jgi:hypothetical protein
MQYLALQNAVLANLIDTPTIVRNAVPGLVQAAHRTLQRKHNFFVMKANKAADTVTNTRVLAAVPSDWKRPRERPYYTDGGLAQYLSFAQEKDALGRFTATDQGRPTYLIDDGTNLNIYPLPDGLAPVTGGQYSVVVPYFKWLPAPTADTDEDWFLLNAAEYIEYQASADGFAKDWDEAHSSYWQNRADKKLTEVINADKERWLGALDTFVPNNGAYGPRSQR